MIDRRFSIRAPLRAFLCAFVCSGVILGGCAGYQFGVSSLYRPDIATVRVPMFRSASFRRFLGERLTEAVIKEIELRTPYKVVQSPDADSVLTGRLIWDTKTVVAENRFDEPRVLETNLRVEFTWIDQHGQPIVTGESVPAPQVLLVLDVSESAAFTPEAGQSISTAQQQAIDQLASEIVSKMERGW